MDMHKFQIGLCNCKLNLSKSDVDFHKFETGFEQRWAGIIASFILDCASCILIFLCLMWICKTSKLDKLRCVCVCNSLVRIYMRSYGFAKA